jgi:hypothetical protein
MFWTGLRIEWPATGRSGAHQCIGFDPAIQRSRRLFYTNPPGGSSEDFVFSLF